MKSKFVFDTTTVESAVREVAEMRGDFFDPHEKFAISSDDIFGGISVSYGIEIIDGKPEIWSVDNQTDAQMCDPREFADKEALVVAVIELITDAVQMAREYAEDHYS